MSYSVITTHAQGLGTNGGTTSSIDTTGADTLFALIPYSAGAGHLPSDSKGNTWTALTLSEASYAGFQIYYAKNATVGTGHTFTVSGSNSFSTIVVIAASGGHLTSPFDQENGATNSGSTSIQPGSVTPTEDNEIVITACCGQPTAGYSIDGGFTSAGTVASSGGNYFGTVSGYLIQTTAAAANPTMSWSTISGDNAARIASFKAAAGGGVTTYNYLTLLGVG